MKNAAIGLIVLGLISLGLSAVWHKLSPEPPAMDEQKEEQFMQAVGDAHGARAEPGGVAEETQKILDERKQALESADRTEQVGKTVFKYVGIICALVGAGLFFWAAQTED
jgi:hypothetical protein